MLPTLPDGTAGSVLTTMAEWAKMYHECRVRHNGLVESLNGQPSN